MAVFGSTQATVMVLKTIHLLSNTMNEVLGDGEIIVQVNEFMDTLKYDENSVLKLSLDLSPHFVVGENSIAVFQSNKENPIPMTIQANWRTLSLPSSEGVPLELKGQLSSNQLSVGDFVKYDIELTNTSPKEVNSPMVVIGIPAGLGLQSWQLKDLEKKKVFEYFEIMDNYLAGYFDHFAPGRKKILFP